MNVNSNFPEDTKTNTGNKNECFNGWAEKNLASEAGQRDGAEKKSSATVVFILKRL